MTKGDVLKRLAATNHERLLTSSVSCSKTFQRMEHEATHCGTCSQCIERRFAAYAAGLDDIDESGLYALDFIETGILLMRWWQRTGADTCDVGQLSVGAFRVR